MSSDFHSRETSLSWVVGGLPPGALLQSCHILFPDDMLFPGSTLPMAEQGRFTMTEQLRTPINSNVHSRALSIWLRISQMCPAAWGSSFPTILPAIFPVRGARLTSWPGDCFSLHLPPTSLLPSQLFPSINLCTWNSILAFDSQKTQSDTIFLSLSKKLPN